MSKTDVIDYAEICNHAKRKRECPACAEITALRAENERLKSVDRLNEQLGNLEGRFNTRIIELEEENAELRAKALIWHKWPAEKPVDKTVYLCGEFDVHGDFIWWYFAEIPRPEGE
jgi:hypothetical protein